LYLASAVLKRYDEQGRLHEDLPFVHWALQDSLHQIDVAIDDFIRNFPVKPISWVLRAMVQPFGKRFDKPSDKIEHQIAHILQNPCSARSRLGEGQYLARVEGSVFGDLEQTLDNIIKVEPIFDRICKALGEKLPMTQLDLLADKAIAANIISEDEATLLRETEAGRLRTINVDDFDPQELLMSTSDKIKKPAVRKRTTKSTKAAKAA
jgi:acyl-CoA dehydrogenase